MSMSTLSHMPILSCTSCAHAYTHVCTNVYPQYGVQDAGKNDHYVTLDKKLQQGGAATGSSDSYEATHKRLYGNGVSHPGHNYIGHTYTCHNSIRHSYISHNFTGHNYTGVSHPGRVFYLLVCRVATGYVVRTQKAHDPDMVSADTGERIFPMLPTPRHGPRAMTRELAPVAGVEPPVLHHTLLAEDHARGGPFRYREFVVFHNANVYPEYLIAYQRFNDALGPLA